MVHLILAKVDKPLSSTKPIFNGKTILLSFKNDPLATLGSFNLEPTYYSYFLPAICLFHEKIMGPEYPSSMKSASFERLGIILIVFGSGYVGLGLFDVVPLELTGVSISNIRFPAGIAVVGCLIAAFTTKDR